ncbi:MAG: ketopantoate reductase family protein [Candidatus Limnocylindrales bacterium]
MIAGSYRAASGVAAGPDHPLHILVAGAGAVGSFLGGLLASRGHDVTLLRRSHQPGVSTARLRITRPDGGSSSVAVRLVRRASDAPAPDLIMLAAKQFALAAVVEGLQGWPIAPALTVQNGIGAEELVGRSRPGAGLIAASLTSPIAKLAADEIHWLGRGGLGLAVVRGPVRPLVARLAADLAAAGLPTAVFADAAAMKWSKLVANLVANATGAILDLDADVLYRDGRSYGIERRQLQEALAVMRRLGLRPLGLPGAPVPLLALGVRAPAWLARPIMVRVVGRARAGKLPSLRAHVRAGGGPSEAPWLNGAVARAGREAGVATPVNAGLAQLLDEVAGSADRRAWFRERPDRLLAALGAGPAPMGGSG